MRYNAYFDMSAICITAIILIAARLVKWIPTAQNRAYRRMVRYVLLTAVCNFIACIIELPQLTHQAWYLPVKYLFDSLYHLFHVMSGVYFLRFSMSITSQRADSMKAKLRLYLLPVITVVLLVINVFVPFLFRYDGAGHYHRMDLMLILYGFGAYYLGVSAWIVIRRVHTLSPGNLRSMLTYAVLASAGIILQSVIPGFMIAEFLNSLALLMMYVNVGTADDIRDERYGIMNRNAFLSEAGSNIRNGAPSAVIFIRVIDTHEITLSSRERIHTALMKEVIQFLKKYREEAWISVWNDNTLVLDMIHPDYERASSIMEEIEFRFHEPWNSGDYTQVLEVSAWCVRYPEDVTTLEELARKTGLLVDIQLHRHRGIIHFPEMDFEVLGFKRRMMALGEEAVRKRTAEVRYEPVLNAESGEIVAARAVIFFPDGTGNLISGNEFIDASAPVDVTASFDEYALIDAAKNSSQLMNRTGVKEVLTRLSLASLSQLNFEDRFRHICARNYTDYHKIMLRISGSTYAQLTEDKLASLDRMQENGWNFAIDDFGTGMSYLSRLTNSSIPHLIMHASVVQSILGSTEGQKLGKGVAHAVHGMHKTLTMTGIQNEEQARIAKALGADYLCGPFLSEPLGAEAFRAWIKGRLKHGLQ